MGSNLLFSKDVCEQLARELVTEQAQLVKHEALVKTMKAKIVAGKQQLIKHLIGGKVIKLYGKKRTVLNITFYEEPDSMMVVVTCGLNPDDVTKGLSLTRSEKRLIEDYDFCRICCDDPFDEESGIDAIRTAEKIELLKNHICLLTEFSWTVDFSNPSSYGFFENSGLDFSDGGNTVMLEDLAC